jgi:TadE-like protein
MLPAFNNFRPSLLRLSGTSSLEFALVAVPFVFMMFGGMELGRYFITRHSLHTLVDETARSAVVNCFNQKTCPYGTAVPTPSNLWSTVPFLQQSLPGASLTASQTFDTATGTRTITVTANYPFAFVLPAWTGLYSSGITETTKLKY